MENMNENVHLTEKNGALNQDQLAELNKAIKIMQKFNGNIQNLKGEEYTQLTDILSELSKSGIPQIQTVMKDLGTVQQYINKMSQQNNAQGQGNSGAGTSGDVNAGKEETVQPAQQGQSVKPENASGEASASCGWNASLENGANDNYSIGNMQTFITNILKNGQISDDNVKKSLENLGQAIKNYKESDPRAERIKRIKQIYSN